MSFSGETDVRAVRKQHRCDACQKHIEIGQPAKRWVGMSDGEFASLIYHTDCREAEIKLNDLRGWGYGDDWCGLADLDHDDLAWLREDFPAVAARMFSHPHNRGQS